MFDDARVDTLNLSISQSISDSTYAILCIKKRFPPAFDTFVHPPRGIASELVPKPVVLTGFTGLKF